jgi:acyl carrier protein
VVSARDPVLDAIRALVERVAGPSRTPAHAGPDTRLTEGYWLDSVELLEVLIACETEFGIAFHDTQDFESGALDTLGTFTHLVRSKLPTPRCDS